MSIFKTIVGITLLTTSLPGEAIGKIGRYSSATTEYVSCAGKEFTGFIGDISYSAGQRINNLGENDFLRVASDLSNATGDLFHGASDILKATEKFSKNSKNLFGSLETNSQWLRGQATNLIRDGEYRDLNAKFNFKSDQVTSELENEEDWDSVKPIIHYRNDRETKKITFNQSVGRRWMNRTKNCLPSINPLKI